MKEIKKEEENILLYFVFVGAKKNFKVRMRMTLNGNETIPYRLMVTLRGRKSQKN